MNLRERGRGAVRGVLSHVELRGEGQRRSEGCWEGGGGAQLVAKRGEQLCGISGIFGEA